MVRIYGASIQPVPLGNPEANMGEDREPANIESFFTLRSFSHIVPSANRRNPFSWPKPPASRSE